MIINGLLYFYIYNNTFYNLYYQGILANVSTATPDYLRWKNNVFHTVDRAYTYPAGSTDVAVDYNARYNCTYAPLQAAGAHDITSDPLMTGAASGNFRPQSTSPVINAGGFLTTITTDFTVPATLFVVGDAGYFFDGEGVIAGDVIELSNGAVRTITDVNYTTNTITVGSSVSWTVGDGVALEYGGTAPDMGAYEYWGPGAMRSCTTLGVTKQ
jgi:hypothetical protein